MKIKKYSMLAISLLTILILTVGCSSNSTGTENQTNENKEKGSTEDETQETITLKFASAHAVTNPFSTSAIEPFMDKVTELTDGQVQFEFYPAEQLGKAGDLLRLVADGVADVGYFANAYFASEMPLGSAIIGMPGLYETSYQGSMAYLRIAQQSPMLETDFLKNGVRPVFAWATPSYDIFSKGKEVRVPDDLKGMKVRTAGGVLSEAVKFGGATPVQLSEQEVYEGFDKGVINAVHMNGATFESNGMGEIGEYATQGLGFSGAGVGFVINEEVYQDLPEEIQKAILQAGEEIAESSSKFYDPENNRAFDHFKESTNMKVNELTDNEKKQWQDFYDEFNEYWSSEQNSEEFKQVLEQFKDEVGELK